MYPRLFVYSFALLFNLNSLMGMDSLLIKFKRLSSAEKFWFIAHPLIAKKVANKSSQAIKVSEQMEKDSLLDGERNGGQVDAFRHAYWMALLSQEINPKKVKKLGEAHERGNEKDFKKRRNEDGELPDSISTVMDLNNNKVGITIGQNNKNINADELKVLVKQYVKEGKMKIVLRDEQGNYLRCDGQIIDMVNWRGKWEIPKCLVNSSKGN